MSAIDERKALDRLNEAWRRTYGSVRSATSPPPAPAGRPGEQKPPTSPVPPPPRP